MKRHSARLDCNQHCRTLFASMGPLVLWGTFQPKQEKRSLTSAQLSFALESQQVPFANEHRNCGSFTSPSGPSTWDVRWQTQHVQGKQQPGNLGWKSQANHKCLKFLLLCKPVCLWWVRSYPSAKWASREWAGGELEHLTPLMDGLPCARIWLRGAVASQLCLLTSMLLSGVTTHAFITQLYEQWRFITLHLNLV